MQAIVLADGDVDSRAAIDDIWPGWADPDALVVAADGGARHAGRLGLTIASWVGDGDSVDPADLAALRSAGVPVRLASRDKDESDTELALRAAIDAGADDVVILGALGGARIDHTLANVWLLALPALDGRTAVLLDARARISLVRAPGPGGLPVRRSLAGRLGDTVSLLPLGDGVDGVTTSGLVYPLVDEPLPAGPSRGLSNRRADANAAIVLRAGSLLVVESPATLAR